MANYSIKAIIGVVTDKMQAGLKGAGGMLKKFGGAAGQAARDIARAFTEAAGAVIGMGVAAVKVAAKIDAGMREVFTLLPPMAKNARDLMTKEMMDLSQEMGKLPKDMTTSIYNALSSGIPKKNVFEFIRVAAKASIGGVSTTAQAVGALTTVLNGYKLPASEAGQVSDTLFTIIKQGVTTMPELAANIGKVTPIASALGISFVEVGAAFAELTKNLGPGKSAETGTMLKSMFAELLKGGTKLSENFKEIAGKTFPEFIKAGGNLGDGLKLLIKHGKNTGKSFVDMTGSLEAGNALMILGAKGAEGLGLQMEAMGKKAGATNAAFEEVSGGVDFAMKQMAVAWIAFKKVVGDSLAPVVKLIMPQIMNTIEMMKKLPWDDLAADIANIVKSFLPLVQIFFNLARRIFPLLGPNLKIIAALFNIALAPALALVARALDWVYGNMHGLTVIIGKVAGFINMLTGRFVALIGHIGKPTFGNEWRKTLIVMKEALDDVTQWIGNWIFGQLPKLVEFIIAVIRKLIEIITEQIIEGFDTWIEKLEKGESMWGQLAASVLRTARNVFTKISGWLDKITKRLEMYLPLLMGLADRFGLLNVKVEQSDKSFGDMLTGGLLGRIKKLKEEAAALLDNKKAEAQATIDTRNAALAHNAAIQRERELANRRKRGAFESMAQWRKRMGQDQGLVVAQMQKEFEMRRRMGGTPAQQIKAATSQQKKFNAEVAKNPMLSMGKGGKIMVQGAAFDPKHQKAIIRKLDIAIQQRGLIYQTLKGKFVNQ